MSNRPKESQEKRENMKALLTEADQVKVVLAGLKTQTRRPLNPQPDTTHWKPEFINKPKEWRKMVQLGPVHHGYDPDLWVLHDIDSPYGCVGYTSRKLKHKVGDILYVKEKLIRWSESMDIDYPYYAADETPIKPDRRFIDLYEGLRQPWCWKGNTRQPYHMPKWAGRIFLEVTAVRIERIQDISEEDAEAEGCSSSYSYCEGSNCMQNDRFAWEEFEHLWNKIYPGSWERNDWVEVIEFKRTEVTK